MNRHCARPTPRPARPTKSATSSSTRVWHVGNLLKGGGLLGPGHRPRSLYDGRQVIGEHDAIVCWSSRPASSAAAEVTARRHRAAGSVAVAAAGRRALGTERH